MPIGPSETSAWIAALFVLSGGLSKAQEASSHPDGCDASPVDHVVCQNDGVRRVSEAVAAILEGRLSQLDTEAAAALREDQRHWLSARADKCPEEDPEELEHCVTGLYLERLSTLVAAAGPTIAVQFEIVKGSRTPCIWEAVLPVLFRTSLSARDVELQTCLARYRNVEVSYLCGV